MYLFVCVFFIAFIDIIHIFCCEDPDDFKSHFFSSEKVIIQSVFCVLTWIRFNKYCQALLLAWKTLLVLPFHFKFISSSVTKNISSSDFIL